MPASSKNPKPLTEKQEKLAKEMTGIANPEPKLKTSVERVKELLNPPNTKKEETAVLEEVHEAPPSAPEILEHVEYLVISAISALDSLPKKAGRLPDKAILAIGKLNGALVFIRDASNNSK